MKIVYFTFIVMSILLSSCSCRWVTTGHYHDREGNEVAVGYYDCPEDDVNPVTPSQVVAKPEISVTTKTETIWGSSKSTYRCTIKINNSGNADAIDVVCNVQVKKPDIPGITGAKTWNFDRSYDLINSKSAQSTTISFSDMSYIGCCMYNCYISITYKDNNGKTYTKSHYFEM